MFISIKMNKLLSENFAYMPLYITILRIIFFL